MPLEDSSPLPFVVMPLSKDKWGWKDKWKNFMHFLSFHDTGKSLSEALLFVEHGENMLCTKIVLNVRNNFCTQHVLPRFELGIFMYWTCNSMNNLSSCYGLVDAKIRASDNDLPVRGHFLTTYVDQILFIIRERKVGFLKSRFTCSNKKFTLKHTS